MSPLPRIKISHRNPQPLQLLRRLVVLIFSTLCLPLSAEDSCAKCHGNPNLLTQENGRLNHLHITSEVISNSVHEGFACVDCHADINGEIIPHRDKTTPVNCFECHDPSEDNHQFHPTFALDVVVPIEYLSGKCSNCHGRHDILPIDEFRALKTIQSQQCSACHQSTALSYMQSAHATAMQDQIEEAPDCITCHSQLTTSTQSLNEIDRKEREVTLCTSCHIEDIAVSTLTLYGDKFVSEYQHSIHGNALHSGNPNAPACSDCHGYHDIYRHDEPNSPVGHREVISTCANCHETEALDYVDSIHAKAVSRGNLDAPNCTSCHGEHNIMDHLDPNAPTAAMNVSEKVCGDCHGSLKLSDRYNLAPDSYDTFAQSFHGLANKGGSVEIVNCTSCHGHHKVLDAENPLSPIHPTQLANTCGQCHPNANEKFGQGKIHVAVDRSSTNPILYWIATIYTWIIVLTVGLMVIHNGADFLKKLRKKVTVHWTKSHPISARDEMKYFVRMTPHERIQHGILALSFITLVITGFMLRYPDAWWVVALRNLNENSFEWRSLIHRIAGSIMIISGFWHCIYLTTTKRGRELFLDLLPCLQDLIDAKELILYNLNLSNKHPAFARFSYMEKFEYWALMWGSLIMTLSGILLWFDNTTIGLFTKLGFDIARTIHFYEAVLATLAIIVWHFYWVIFNPNVYPMNLSWLTGNMSEEEMETEHLKQLKEIKDKESSDKT